MEAMLADIARRACGGRGLLVSSTVAAPTDQHGAAPPSRSQSIDQIDPTRIFPRHGGAGFSLLECVRVLFDIELPQVRPAA